MDLFNCMRVFIRVSEVGSFTAVAKLLNVSTPHVSRCVADLETTVQARLIQRNTRHQSLTEAGARYLVNCREIIARVDQAAIEANESYLTPRGCLRILADTEFGVDHLSAMVSEYSKEYPDVNLDLTLTSSIANIIDEQQDVQIVVSGVDHLPSSEMVAQYLGGFSSVLCAAPTYLKQHGIPETPQDLAKHVCIRRNDDGHQDEWTFDTVDGPVVVPLGKGFQSNLAQTISASAAAGMGICLLPSFVAAKALSAGTLLRVLPEFELEPRSVYAMYSSRRFLDAKIKTWVELLKAKLPRQLASSKRVVGTTDYFATQQARSLKLVPGRGKAKREAYHERVSVQ